MAGRTVRWLGLVLGMLSPMTAEAQSSRSFPVQTVKRPPLRPLRPQTPFQRRVERFEVQSRVSEMNLEALPAGALPERKVIPAPAVLPPDAADLKLEPAPGTRTASGDSRLHLRWSGLGYVIAGLSSAVDHHISTFALTCQKKTFGARSKPSPVFWEALVPTPQGARLVVGQSWFDAKECRLAPGPRHEIALHTVASIEGKPVIFGAQQDGELLLLGPMLQVHMAPPASDQVGPAPRYQRGEFSWIHWKPVRGGASLLAGGVHPSSLSDWWKKLGHEPAFPLAPGDPQLQIRLDISQSISEPRPIGLLTLLQPKRRDAIVQN
jgi:hypothetical protein